MFWLRFAAMVMGVALMLIGQATHDVPAAITGAAIYLSVHIQIASERR